MSKSNSLPVVGLPTDTHNKDGLDFQSVGEKYLHAVHDGARALPVLIPSLGGNFEFHQILDQLDGIVITGATSNVHPPHYGDDPSEMHEPYDHARDVLTLSLIPAVLERGIPLLCICRGFQELNVVFGGTLDTEVQEKSGHLDHRAPDSDDLAVRYGPAHPIAIEAGGFLHTILKKSGTMVNTVHRQAIARLGEGLKVEARAPDGIIEAVSIPAARGFALGVQWHPEFRAMENPDSVRLFAAFGDACRGYRQNKSLAQ